MNYPLSIEPLHILMPIGFLSNLGLSNQLFNSFYKKNDTSKLEKEVYDFSGEISPHQCDSKIAMITTIFRWKTSMFDNKSAIKNRKFVFSFVRDSNSYLKVLTFQPSSVRVRYAAATDIASTRGEITSLQQNF